MPNKKAPPPSPWKGRTDSGESLTYTGTSDLLGSTKETGRDSQGREWYVDPQTGARQLSPDSAEIERKKYRKGGVVRRGWGKARGGKK